MDTVRNVKDNSFTRDFFRSSFEIIDPAETNIDLDVKIIDFKSNGFDKIKKIDSDLFANKVAGYKNTGWVRNYLDLGSIGYVCRLKVLDGQVMADVFGYPGEDDVLFENKSHPNYHKDLILRPVYIVQDVGMISKVDPSQKDNIVIIGGFDICINKKKKAAK